MPTIKKIREYRNKLAKDELAKNSTVMFAATTLAGDMAAPSVSAEVT